MLNSYSKKLQKAIFDKETIKMAFKVFIPFRGHFFAKIEAVSKVYGLGPLIPILLLCALMNEFYRLNNHPQTRRH